MKPSFLVPALLLGSSLFALEAHADGRGMVISNPQRAVQLRVARVRVRTPPPMELQLEWRYEAAVRRMNLAKSARRFSVKNPHIETHGRPSSASSHSNAVPERSELWLEPSADPILDSSSVADRWLLATLGVSATDALLVAGSDAAREAALSQLTEQVRGAAVRYGISRIQLIRLQLQLETLIRRAH